MDTTHLYPASAPKWKHQTVPQISDTTNGPAIGCGPSKLSIVVIVSIYLILTVLSCLV